ncbi:MAG TPA: BON domain-containing protein [Planctomycetota bacterium]|nr:BON domain-containing protein [Planctomycetota bacterium]
MSLASKTTRRLKRVSERKSSASKNGGGKSVRDAALATRIADQLRAIHGHHVKVSVHDGYVTLAGAVKTYRQKERLHRFVMRLHGVRALKDLLVIEAESVEDRKIAFLVRNALDAHAELPPGTAVVHVSDGVVKLDGHVRRLEERSIAEYVASHCRGVKKVLNELTVDPLEEVSDEAACRAVRGALKYCDEFETQKVTVSCADGAVCLRGEVPTMMDRTLAEELARMQAGVRAVENNIVVRTAVN